MSEDIKTGEIQVTSIHNIEGAGLRNEIVEDVDIVDFPLCNLNKRRNISAQIQKRMKFDCGFANTEFGPWEQRKTQVNGRGIESVNRLVQFDSKLVVSVKPPRGRNQDLSKVGVDSPFPGFVGVGQIVSGNSSTNAHVVKFGMHCTKARLDIPKTFPVSELCKGHHQKLIEA